jgi:uncharacterized membrane-anchored protein
LIWKFRPAISYAPSCFRCAKASVVAHAFDRGHIMSARFEKILTIASVALVLAVVNFLIFSKERIIRSGKTIYLELAPVDPRALMQGDYMALNFSLARGIESSRSEADRTQHNGEFQQAAIMIDARGVATLAEPSASSNDSIRFRWRDGSVWLGTNAFFFEEGSAERYEVARYGQFKLNPSSGEAVLVALADEQLQAL